MQARSDEQRRGDNQRRRSDYVGMVGGCPHALTLRTVSSLHNTRRLLLKTLLNRKFFL
jgi:hypothetical protein